MSEEKKPRKLSMGEVWKRTQLISHLSSRGKQGFDEVSKRCDMWLKLIGDEVKAKQKAEDEQSDKHRMTVATEKQAELWEQIKQEQKLTHEKLDATHAAALRAADNTDSMLAEWHKWLKGGCKGLKSNGNRTKLLKPMRDAIWDKWLRFKKGEADIELPDGSLRRSKRACKEFYEKYAKKYIFTSPNNGKTWTLQQMCPTLDLLETAISSAGKSARRDQEKSAKRKTDKKIK